MVRWSMLAYEKPYICLKKRRFFLNPVISPTNYGGRLCPNFVTALPQLCDSFAKCSDCCEKGFFHGFPEHGSASIPHVLVCKTLT